MNFVDEQHGRLPGVLEAIRRSRQDAPHIGHIRFHAAQPLELAFGLARNDLSERRFACAGWSVENQRLNTVGFDGAAEQLIGTEDMGLADKFVQTTRPHARRQRLMPRRLRTRRSTRLRSGRTRKEIITRHGERLTAWDDLPKIKRPSPFNLSLGGQTLSLIPLGVGSNYTLYGADISLFAGQVENLTITALAAPNSADYFDSIVFSPSTVPEPSGLALATLGALLIGFRRSRHSAR